VIARLKHAGWALILVALVWFFWCGVFYNVKLAFGSSGRCQTRSCLVAAIRWQKHDRQQLRQRLAVRYRRDATYAIRLASAAFGVPTSAMRSVAWCESRMGAQTTPQPGTGASGLMQFEPSTWAHTPFAAYGFSVWDNVANALAAAQIVAHYGGWGQWTCQP
jgi:soluble lytic murein transglycosylase-like protein